MTKRDEHSKAAGELKALEQHLGALAEIVESEFAESVMVLMEGDFGAAQEVRVEDYKAHQAWLQADSVCVDLLASGELGLKEVQFVSTAIKAAMWLKMSADESARISRLMRECSPNDVGSDGPMETLGEMATLTQSMLSEGVEAFINRDGGAAQRLHLVFGELGSLRRRLVEQVAGKVPSAAKGAGRTFASLLMVGCSLEAIGEYVLELAAHTARLYLSANSSGELKAEAE
jgi:phosphate uptake regulator